MQLCVQGLILEEHGYPCPAGVLYFVESRERVRVAFDHELRAQTLRAVHGLRLMAAGGRIPPPLDDSPKCPRCSLVGICLPDEVNFLNKGIVEPRPLAVPRDDLLPLYVQAQRARVAKAGETLEISVDDQPKTTARLVEVSQVVLLGNVSITTPCIHELMRREIPISWHSYGGWFLGHSVGIGHKNVELRTAQYRRSFEPPFCQGVARALVAAKIRNARTLLRRNWRDEPAPEHVLAELKRHAERSEHSRSMDELLGVEGNAAAIYFAHFSRLLKPGPGEPVFDFARRNRRPPADPVNALLSFAYTLLVRTITVTLSSVGLDPYRGFYHQPRYGRPALALDLMEPFRPLIAESSVIQAINNGEVHMGDFVHAAGSVALRPDGRKRFIATFERRLSQEMTHPSVPRELPPRHRTAGPPPRPAPPRRAAGVPSGRDPLKGMAVVDEHLYVVAYDIGEPRRWRRVFKLMNGYGEWLQLSVFQCRLTRRRRAELAAALNGLINHNQDHVLILDLGDVERVDLRVLSLGKTYEPMVREPIII